MVVAVGVVVGAVTTSRHTGQLEGDHERVVMVTQVPQVRQEAGK